MQMVRTVGLDIAKSVFPQPPDPCGSFSLPVAEYSDGLCGYFILRHGISR